MDTDFHFHLDASHVGGKMALRPCGAQLTARSSCVPMSVIFVEKERFCQTFAFLVLTAEALFTGTLT